MLLVKMIRVEDSCTRHANGVFFMNNTDLFSRFAATVRCVDEDKHRLQKLVLQVFGTFYFSKKSRAAKTFGG